MYGGVRRYFFAGPSRVRERGGAGPAAVIPKKGGADHAASERRRSCRFPAIFGFLLAFRTSGLDLGPEGGGGGAHQKTPSAGQVQHGQAAPNFCLSY
jgi:hypothetical protein